MIYQNHMMYFAS